MKYRWFSASPLCRSGLKSSQINVTQTASPKPLIASKDLVFGKYFTDHMLEIDYIADKGGWQPPQIHPYQDLKLDPSCSVLHYGLECFEGMKAYKDKQGHVRMFRPQMNMARFQSSSGRLMLPAFDGQELLKCIEKLIKTESRWIPSERGFSLYIRPTMIGTQASLGVGESSSAKIFVICSPVGPYYKTGFAAVSLLADPSNVRAWPGGVGDFKVGGNYAPTIQTQMKAAEEGFQQILWLLPDQRQKSDYLLTEVGTMNLFALFKRDGNKRELVTPPLDGTILPGVTRDSIIKLVSEDSKFDDITVSERKVSIRELFEASDRSELLEMFGAGTAAIVSPIKRIRYVEGRDKQGHITKHKDLTVPLNPAKPDSQAGPLAEQLNNLITSIQYGEVKHPFSVVI